MATINEQNLLVTIADLVCITEKLKEISVLYEYDPALLTSRMNIDLAAKKTLLAASVVLSFVAGSSLSSPIGGDGGPV